MNGPLHALPHGQAHGPKSASVAPTVDAKGREGKGPERKGPDLNFLSVAEFASWRSVSDARGRDAMMALRARWSV